MKQWWKDYPWRQIQTNLREIDMLDIDADEYAGQLLAFGATVAMINVGGIVASYETELPDQFQSPFLKGDSLQKVIGACHKAGIRVVARMDFSKIRRPVYERHPDWAYRRADGTVVDYNGNIHACICGGYQQEYCFRILREVLEKLPVDGLFINMGGFVVGDYSYHYHGFCHCEHCRRLFRERYGYDIPEKEDLEDPAYRAYACFRDDVMKEYRARLKELVRSINPEVAVDGEDFQRMESNTEFKRPLPFWQYSASSNTRAIRGVDQHIVPSNTSVDFIGFYYRHVAVSAAQQKLRLYQDLANLGGLDYYIIGRLDNHRDRTGYEAVREVFRFHKEHEADYRGLRPVSEALLVRTGLWDGKSEERGWIRALTEAHILFDEAFLPDLSEESLRRYKAVIVPGIACVSDEAVRMLDAYAHEGGTLIVCGGCGRFTQRCEPRELPRFRCLGIEKFLCERRDMVSAMLLRKERDAARFPSMKDTEVLMLGDSYVYAQYAEESEKLLSLVPPQPFGPPELCYSTQVTDEPGVVISPYGSGRGIFVPWLAGGLYYREGYENTFFFMKDVLTGPAGLRPVSDSLTEMVEVTAARGGSHMLVQFVNNTGHFGTSYMRPVPVRGVSVRIPCERPVAGAVSLIDGRRVACEREEGRVLVNVGTVGEFESVRLDFAEPAARRDGGSEKE